jgi:hypothetical protein
MLQQESTYLTKKSSCEEEISFSKVRRLLKLRASLDVVTFDHIIKGLNHALEEIVYGFRSSSSN